MFAGRFIPEKRIAALIPAIDRARRWLPQLRGELYGDGPERDRIRRAIDDAGLAGVIGGNAFVTEPGMALTVGSIIFVVVVVGGMGSLAGAFIASLLIGIVQTFAVAFDDSFVTLLAHHDDDLVGRVGIVGVRKDMLRGVVVNRILMSA